MPSIFRPPNDATKLTGILPRRPSRRSSEAIRLIEQFQKAHVKTMDPAMQAMVKMMMERMNRNLAGLKENLDFLEKEIQGGNNLEVITSRTGEMLKYLDDLSKMKAAQGAQPDLPVKKEMDQKL